MSTLRRWAPWLLRIVVVAAVVIWLGRGADLDQLWATLARLPVWAFVLAFALGMVNMTVAAVRWRVLMGGFGVTDAPPVRTLLRLVLVGLFYNTYVPGSIGGDVVRGVVSRRVFDNAAASYVVVLLERLIGLSALGIVLVVGLIIGPELVPWRSLLPWIGGLLGLGVLIFAAGLLTGRLQRMFRKIPRVHRPSALLTAFGISFVGHALNVAMFWVLASALALPLDVPALMVVVPLGLVAAVLPLAIAGIGPREAAVIGLLGLLGIPKMEAAGLSLAFAAVLLVLAATGGLLQLLGGPLDPSAKA